MSLNSLNRCCDTYLQFSGVLAVFSGVSTNISWSMPHDGPNWLIFGPWKDSNVHSFHYMYYDSLSSTDKLRLFGMFCRFCPWFMQRSVLVVDWTPSNFNCIFKWIIYFGTYYLSGPTERSVKKLRNVEQFNSGCAADQVPYFKDGNLTDLRVRIYCVIYLSFVLIFLSYSGILQCGECVPGAYWKVLRM